MAIHKSIEPQTLEIDDPQAKILASSARWIEALVPVGDGTRFFIIAGLYGISGAASNVAKRKENERLIASAIARMNHFHNTPYLLTGDFNIGPEKSQLVAVAAQKGDLVDLFREWALDAEELSPTFYRDGVFKGMGQ